MAKRNALMEWLDQTKKLAKSKDYATLDAIDKVFEVLHFIRPKVLLKHSDLINDICERYHKPNPLKYIRSRRRTDSLFKERTGLTLQKFYKRKVDKRKLPKHCPAIRDWRTCKVTDFGSELLGKFVDGSFQRLEGLTKDVVWQWFEIIDFMYERPELINPEAIDEYVTEQISTVCLKYRKNNPLANGLRKRFGKFWRDKEGRWHKERRRRF